MLPIAGIVVFAVAVDTVAAAVRRGIPPSLFEVVRVRAPRVCDRGARSRRACVRAFFDSYPFPAVRRTKPNHRRW